MSWLLLLKAPLLTLLLFDWPALANTAHLNKHCQSIGHWNLFESTPLKSMIHCWRIWPLNNVLANPFEMNNSTKKWSCEQSVLDKICTMSSELPRFWLQGRFLMVWKIIHCGVFFVEFLVLSAKKIYLLPSQEVLYFLETWKYLKQPGISTGCLES